MRCCMYPTNENPRACPQLIKPTIIEMGLKYGLATGNWGVKTSRVRQGVAQVLSRLTASGTLSHMRRVNTPIEKTGKLVQPRKLHPTQWGVICPSETPEGASVGLVKNMALLTNITIATPSDPVREAAVELGTALFTERSTPAMFVGNKTKVLVNGDLLGSHAEPDRLFAGLKAMKQAGSISVFTSVVWNVAAREIALCTEGGRFVRPLLVVRDGKTGIDRRMAASLAAGETEWASLVIGRDGGKSVIEYLDVEETNTSMIAMLASDLEAVTAPGAHDVRARPTYTHLEVDPSAMLGVVAGSIPFSDHNQAPRNTYQCLCRHEPVLMADGTRKAIGDVRVGDEVVTFDLDSMHTSTTVVVHQYERPADKTVFDVTLLGGRRVIRATRDHKFMTHDAGWVAVEDFTRGTLLGVLPSVVTPSPCLAAATARLAALCGKAVVSWRTDDTDALYADVSRVAGSQEGDGEDVENVEDVECVPPAWIRDSGDDTAAREYIAAVMGAALDGGGSVTWTNDTFGFAPVRFAAAAWAAKALTDRFGVRAAVTEDGGAFEIEAADIVPFFRRVGYRYAVTKTRDCAFIVEYVLSKTPMLLGDWTAAVKRRGPMLFLPVAACMLVSGPVTVSDITVEADSHSFIGGDGFAVSNSAMGKQVKRAAVVVSPCRVSMSCLHVVSPCRVSMPCLHAAVVVLCH